MLNGVTLALMLLVASRDVGEWIDHAFVPLMAVLFVLNLVAATQDIATDGHAVSRLDEHLRGVGNSVQIIGYKVGLIVGGGVLFTLALVLAWTLIDVIELVFILGGCGSGLVVRHEGGWCWGARRGAILAKPGILGFCRPAWARRAPTSGRDAGTG